MTPEMYFDIASDERKSSSRESRRLSAVDSTPIVSKRFLMVPDDSSAARMPRPGATMASATLLSSARFIATLLHRCAFIGDFAASLRRWQRADRFVVRYPTLSTSIPGKGLPSSHSRNAPPAVET